MLILLNHRSTHDYKFVVQGVRNKLKESWAARKYLCTASCTMVGGTKSETIIQKDVCQLMPRTISNSNGIQTVSIFLHCYLPSLMADWLFLKFYLWLHTYYFVIVHFLCYYLFDLWPVTNVAAIFVIRVLAFLISSSGSGTAFSVLGLLFV